MKKDEALVRGSSRGGGWRLQRIGRGRARPHALGRASTRRAHGAEVRGRGSFARGARRSLRAAHERLVALGRVGADRDEVGRAALAAARVMERAVRVGRAARDRRAREIGDRASPRAARREVGGIGITSTAWTAHARTLREASARRGPRTVHRACMAAPRLAAVAAAVGGEQHAVRGLRACCGREARTRLLRAAEARRRDRVRALRTSDEAEREPGEPCSEPHRASVAPPSPRRKVGWRRRNARVVWYRRAHVVSLSFRRRARFVHHALCPRWL